MRPDLRTAWQRISAEEGRVFLKSPLGSLSYRRLAGLIRSFCAAFDLNHIEQGSRVVIVTTNEPVAGAAFLAAMLDGLVPVMLSDDSALNRIKAICASLEPSLLIADKALLDQLSASDLNGTPTLAVPAKVQLEAPFEGLNAAWRGFIQRIKPGPAETCLNLPTGGRDPHLPAADETSAYILFTSGTTKAPSGVQITRNSLMAQLETLTRLFAYGADSRIFNATPLAHTDGLVQGLLLAAVNGATLLRPGPFSLPNLEEWLDSLGRFEATHFITNPTVAPSAVMAGCALETWPGAGKMVDLKLSGAYRV